MISLRSQVILHSMRAVIAETTCQAVQLQREKYGERREYVGGEYYQKQPQEAQRAQEGDVNQPSS